MQPRSTRYGRVATDLRVSLTDRCNLRCTYCMPAEGLDWLPMEQMLTDDEVVRLIDDRGRAPRRARGAVHRRRAAGPPRAASTSSRRTAALQPRPEISLTTNALGLARTAQALADAGLDRVNVSLDTIRSRDVPRDHPPRPVRTTWSPGSRRPTRPGSARSRSTPCCCAGVNDDQAPELLAWCLERGYELRFIEQMPLDAQHGWSRDGDGHRRRDLRLAGGASSCSRRPTSRGAARRPSCSSSTAARPRSASSPRSPGRSAATATGSGSPPTARSATACSPARSPTCAAALRAGCDRRGDRRPLARGDGDQAPGPRHRRPDVPPARPGRCRPSAAERSATALGRSSWSGRRRSEEAARAPGSPTATPGARRTRARSCGGRGCASSGCSSSSAQTAAGWCIPWPSRSSVVESSAARPLRGLRAPGKRCRTATGEAVRHQPSASPDGRELQRRATFESATQPPRNPPRSRAGVRPGPAGRGRRRASGRRPAREQVASPSASAGRRCSPSRPRRTAGAAPRR